MFPNYNYNYNYNYPPQFNSYGAAQNFPGINYNPAQVFHQQYYQQQQQQQFQGYPSYPQHQQNNLHGGPFLADDPNVIDIGSYVAPSLADPEGKWATKEDIDASYDRGSTVLRQKNNSTIDDYYKQFTRPITEYVPIDIKGQPTYVYQDLGTAAQKGATSGSINTSVSSQGSSTHAHKPADAKKPHQPSPPSSSDANRAATSTSASEKPAIKEERNTPTNVIHTHQAPAARRTSSNSKSESRKQRLPTATQQGSHQQQTPAAQKTPSPPKLNTQLSQPTASTPTTPQDQHQGARTQQIPVHHKQVPVQQQPHQQQIPAQQQQIPVQQQQQQQQQRQQQIPVPQQQAPVQHRQVPVQPQPQQQQRQQQIPVQQQQQQQQHIHVQQQQIPVQRQQIPVQQQQLAPRQQQQPQRQEIPVHHQHQPAIPVQQQIPVAQKVSAPPAHPAPQQILGVRQISAEPGVRGSQPSQPVEQKKSGEQKKQQQPEQKVSLTDQKLQGDFHSPQLPMKDENNPVVFFDIGIDDHPRGRLVMELFRHALPETAQNFLFLCGHQQGFGYRLSYFHRIIPGFMAQGGDFEKSDGTGGYSIYGPKFDDEGFPFQHDRPGLLSMANTGPDTNGSQFFITFAPCPHLDGKHVVFGQILQGFHVLKDLELCGTKEGEVTRAVQIANCDLLQ